MPDTATENYRNIMALHFIDIFKEQYDSFYRDDEATNLFASYIGRKIISLEVQDDALLLSFHDAAKLKLFDREQDCCEKRYMVSDDDLSYYAGSVLLDVEIRAAANIPDPRSHTEDIEHEVQFLVIHTSKGEFSVANHNEHNGYYGGFCLSAQIE